VAHMPALCLPPGPAAQLDMGTAAEATTAVLAMAAQTTWLARQPQEDGIPTEAALQQKWILRGLLQNCLWDELFTWCPVQTLCPGLKTSLHGSTSLQRKRPWTSANP
jgi:hypothetical protein